MPISHGKAALPFPNTSSFLPSYCVAGRKEPLLAILTKGKKALLRFRAGKAEGKRKIKKRWWCESRAQKIKKGLRCSVGFLLIIQRREVRKEGGLEEVGEKG